MRPLTIRPMTEAETEAYAATATEQYVRQRVEFGAETRQVAEAKAEESMNRFWPDGRPASGHHLFAAEVDGEVVGSLWLAEQLPGGQPGQGWICDVQIVPERRGNGYGRALMLAAEAKAAELGCATLGLNVFGGNVVAISLYQSLGFQPTSLQMSKPLVTG